MNHTNKPNEIGSEFWFDPQNVMRAGEGMSAFLTEKFPEANHDCFFTLSGRSACQLLLQHVRPKKKSVLLPEYTCETVIMPFAHAGYDIHFYEVEHDLGIEIGKWRSQYQNTQPGIVLLHPYFGFDTIACVREKYEELKSDGTIVIEDITHSLLSRFPNPIWPDYYVASLRKWLGIPDGGVLIDCSKMVPIIPPLEHDAFFVDTRTEAFTLKNLFMKGGNKVEKENFLSLFAQADRYLKHSFEPKIMSQMSFRIMENTDWDFIYRQRRVNYHFLETNFKYFHHLLYPVFDSLPELTCPLFMPVWIKTNRYELRSHFIRHHIYPPIHWPVSKYITNNGSTHVNDIYHHCLSIPCDQRYRQEDLQQVIDVLENYQ